MALVAASIGLASLSSVTAQSPSPAPSPRPSPAPSPSPGVDRERPQAGQQSQSTTKEAKDAQFVQTMIQHEERGIEMARLEEDQGSASSVKRLATQLRRAQERRLSELQRVARSMPGAADAMHTEHQGEAMLERLKSVSGEDLDRAFLEEMAEHHRMSIHTAQLATLQDLELDRLAQRMLEEQRRELEQIEQQQATVSSKR